MSKGRRRRLAAARVEVARNKTSSLTKLLSKCLNGCGERGPHFVPPSFGDPGFFICTPLPQKETAS